MKKVLLRQNLLQTIILSLFFLFSGIITVLGQTTVIDAQGTTMTFNSTTRDSANNLGNVGGYAIYNPLCTIGGVTIKGKLSVTNIENATIETWDNDTENENRFQPEIDAKKGGGYIIFKLEFFNAATDDTVYLSNFNITGVDCDGSNEYQEYYKFSNLSTSGYSGYLIDAANDLSCIQENSPESNVLRFIGSTTNYAGLAINNEASFLVNFNTPTNEVSWEMGVFCPQSGFDCSDIPLIPSNNNANPIVRQFSTQIGPGHHYF